MDIINAAMVRQNQRSGGRGGAARGQRGQREEDRAEPGRLPDAHDHAAQEPGSVQAHGPGAIRRPARAVQLGVAASSEMNKQIGSLTDSLRGNQVLDGAGLIGRTVIAPGNDVYLPDAAKARRVARRACIDVPAGASRRAARGQGSSRRAREDAGARRRARRAGFHLGRHHQRRRRRPGRRLQHRSRSPASAIKNVSLKTSVAAHVSSVALDPATGALMLDTDSLGELAHERRRARAVTQSNQGDHSMPFRIALSRSQRRAGGPERHRQQHRQHLDHRLQGLAHRIRRHVRRVAAGRVAATPAATACACRRRRAAVRAGQHRVHRLEPGSRGQRAGHVHPLRQRRAGLHARRRVPDESRRLRRQFDEPAPAGVSAAAPAAVSTPAVSPTCACVPPTRAPAGHRQRRIRAQPAGECRAAARSRSSIPPIRTPSTRRPR